MHKLSEGELAVRAGTTSDKVQQLVRLGILTPAEDDGMLQPSDIQRVRLVECLEASGISVEDLAEAICAGHLTLAFVGTIWPNPVELVPGKSLRDLASAVGVRMELMQRLREAAGLPLTPPDDPMREDDVESFSATASAVAAGFRETELIRHSRLLGESLSRLAESQVRLFHSNIEEPMLQSGMSQREIMLVTSRLAPTLQPVTEQVLLWMYRRNLEHYIFEDLVEHVEAALEQAGVQRRAPSRPPAIAFLDLTGYTALTEEVGDEAAAELAQNLAELANTEARRYRGRLVKLLGDGVVFHFPDPGDAVRCCVELIGRMPRFGLPPGRAGIECGPVVFRAGDYFGRTVNVAARIADYAGPEQLLVTADVTSATESESFEYELVGPVHLKGVHRPVQLYVVKALRS